jgi:hypothetical protein
MALYVFDGTWNEDENAPEQDTNVVRFRGIYEGPVEYREGVGTRFGTVGRILGGVFGVGGRSRIEEMYDAAKRNWETGDRIFDVVGFSRGAALAVHFVNVLAEQGLKLSNGSVEKPKIRFLGVWDIVGSFGFPIDFIIKFQHINLGWTIDRVPSAVQNCFHAMALDERRQAFRVTRLKASPQVEERWFKGVHGDVGGGNGNVGRNAIALHWMLEQARACGLPISNDEIDLAAAQRDPLARIAENFDPVRNSRRPTQAADRYHPTATAKRLQVNESATFPVRAADRYNWAGVRLEGGASYRLEVSGNQKWQDASISCGAEGWTSESLPWYKEAVVSHFEKDRRLPPANWFELIGAVDDEDTDLFRIGKGCQLTAPKDGDLHAFANDVRTRYGNNTGQLNVTVTRTA